MRKVLLLTLITLTTALGLLPAGPRAASSAKVPTPKEAAAPDFSSREFGDASAASLDYAGGDGAAAGVNAYARFGGGAAAYGLFQSKPSAACQNWRRRFNYASQMGLRAARFGSVEDIYYWNAQIEKLNAEYRRKRYCDSATSRSGGSGGSRGPCDRQQYDSCVADARRMTSPTTGGMTSTGISMMAQCRQWISGCR